MSGDQIDALGRPDTWADVFDERSLAAIRLADATSGDSASLDADLVGELRSHFSEIELSELILVAGQANLNNRAGNAAKQLLGDGEPSVTRRS